MNKYLSLKLKVIQFFLMIMVVFLHSYNLVVKTNAGNIVLNKGYSSFIQDFFSQGITRIAVPLFFSISGYLFFLKMKGTLIEFISKFSKRLKTLFLPYLIWSIWGLLLYYILQILPHSNTFFTNKLIRDYSIIELLSTLFINPIPYQLWFVRDLLMIIILSPVIYWLIKYFKFFTVLFFLFTWFYGFNFILFSNEALFFFVCGAFLCIDNNKLTQIEISEKSWIYICLWIVIVFFKTILVYKGFQNEIVLNTLHKTSILIGILAIWRLYDFLFKNKDLNNYKFYSIFSFSFFLYAFHEPILTIFTKGLFYILGKSELVSLIIYIVAPLLTITVAIFIGNYLKRTMPKFYGIVTGGR